MTEIIQGKFGHGRHLKVSEVGQELRIDIVTGEGTRMEGLVLDNNALYGLVKALVKGSGVGTVANYGTITMPKPVSVLRAEVVSELYGHSDYAALPQQEKFIVTRFVDLIEKVRDSDDRR